LIRAANNYAAALANNRGRKIGSKVPIVITTWPNPMTGARVECPRK
jgi:hypothetical protein